MASAKSPLEFEELSQVIGEIKSKVEDLVCQVGLGTWEITGSKARESTLNALECGYRMIDTAMIYHNEDQVGLAIEESGISRENIFVTTKIWNTDHDDVVGPPQR